MIVRPSVGKVLIAFMCLVSIVLSGRAVALAGEDSEGWTSLNEGLYINGRSIASTSADTVTVWVKIVPGDGSELQREAIGLLLEKGKKYQALAYRYTGYLSEIDCSKDRHRELMVILYDINKNIVLSLERSSASWETIAPGSSFLPVRSAVCRQERGTCRYFLDELGLTAQSENFR
jgi:Surface-adhesin protein E